MVENVFIDLSIVQIEVFMNLNTASTSSWWTWTQTAGGADKPQQVLEQRPRQDFRDYMDLSEFLMDLNTDLNEFFIELNTDSTSFLMDFNKDLSEF